MNQRHGRSPSRIALPAAFLVLAACTAPDPDPRPRLAVTVVVDQLTPDLLERYEEAWTGGFRRLVDEGFVYRDAVQDHAITFTSPGHATPTTGVFPARHGVVGNSWREFRDGEWTRVRSVVDPDADRVGGSGSGHSPHNLLVDGFPDWLLEHHQDARVVSLSGKSTAGVLMAGRTGRESGAPVAAAGSDGASEGDAGTDAGSGRAHAYWYSSGAEGFVTSTHYRDELPDWVAAFNEGVVETYGAEDCWESQVPPELADLSRRDTVDYEADGVHTHFPHCVDQDPYSGPAHFISRTPALDVATLDLAREAVESLELGLRDPDEHGPDYLAVALSQTDRIGHTFGPYSREQMDNLMRLDQELGRFLAYLDERLGPDGYVVALTADHGVLPLPEYLAEQGEYGVRLTSEFSDTLSAVAERVGVEPPRTTDDGGDARRRMAEELEAVDWIEEAMPLELLEDAHERVVDSGAELPADTFHTLYGKSFHPERVPTRVAAYGVEVRLKEATLSRSSGTTHGVPYLHDRRVPFLFYGAGIGPGSTDEPVRTVDLAPTLADLLDVPAPDGLDGRPLRP